jgi:surface polysaccharide O-acyltransferase-like enzyme
METGIPRTFHSVDALRLFAVLAVICLHSEPFVQSQGFDPTPLQDALGFLVNVCCLFAVPFFFLASGFFFALSWARSGGDRGALVRTANRFLWRVLWLFLLWGLLYRSWPSLQEVHRSGLLAAAVRGVWKGLASVGREPVRFLLHGGEQQLWFLSALALAAAVCAGLALLGRRRWLPPLCLGCFLLGLLGQGYAAPLRELAGISLGLNTRVGLFFSLPFFGLGFQLALRRVEGHTLRLPRPGNLILPGLALLLSEATLLNRLYGGDVAHYYLGSLPLALGLFLWALERPDWARSTPFPAMGRMALGVYASHMLLLSPLLEPDWAVKASWAWQTAHPLLVLAASLGLSALLCRVPGLRFLVASPPRPRRAGAPQPMGGTPTLPPPVLPPHAAASP